MVWKEMPVKVLSYNVKGLKKNKKKLKLVGL
jgi:hypothetical protein